MRPVFRLTYCATFCIMVNATAVPVALANDYPTHPNSPTFIEYDAPRYPQESSREEIKRGAYAHTSEDNHGESKEETKADEHKSPSLQTADSGQSADQDQVRDKTGETKKEETNKAEISPESEDEAHRGEAQVVNGAKESLDVAVTSWRDLPFKTVKRQTFDYSCGSAAVATLLTHVYGKKTSEAEVFKAMFEKGDQEKIKREGFSLLDMRNHLRGLGYNANGYKMNINSIQKHKVPFIALINRDGYNHFVVVKSVNGPVVLVGDPSLGNVIYKQEEFLKMWNGVSLIVTNYARLARETFLSEKEWTYAHPKALPELGEHPGIDSANLPFPNWQIAPARLDILGTVFNSFTKTN